MNSLPLPPSLSSTPYFTPLKTSLSYLLLAQSLESLLSGFELELYEAEEWDRIWWVSARVAARLESRLESLITEKQSLYLKGKLEECRALRAMCRGAFLVRLVSSSSGRDDAYFFWYTQSTMIAPPPAPKMISPFLTEISSTLMDRRRFDFRFSDLVHLPSASTSTPDDVGKFADWKMYQADLETTSKLEVSYRFHCERKEHY